MHHATLSFFAVTALGLAISGRAEVQRVDFGTSDSELAKGWSRVTEADVYTEAAGRGWIVKPPGARRALRLFSRDENFATQTGFLKLGPLLRDHVIAGRNYSAYPNGDYSFRVRVGPGEFVGAAVMGVMTEKHATLINRPPFWWRACGVRANGKEVARFDHGDIQRQLEDRGRLSEQDFLPGDSLFDRGVRPHYKVITFKFQGPVLTLSMPTFCPVNALLVAPRAEAAALKKALEDALAGEKAFVDAQYTESRETEAFAEPVRRAAEKAGAVPFTRPMHDIGPYARPTPEEASRPCGEFLPAGEKGILRFGLLPLRDLRTVQVTVSPFHLPSGRELAGASVSVWLSQLVPMAAVRTGDYYRIVPDYAFQYTPRTLRKNVTRLFSVYVKTDAAAAPGDYEAVATVSSPDLPHPLEQRLVVKVLPFRIDPPDMLFGMYWGNPFSTRLRHAWQQMRIPNDLMRQLCTQIDLTAFREMRETGFNTAAFGPASPVTVDEKGKIKVDDALWQLWCDRVANYEKVFGRSPLPAYGIGWSGLTSTRATRGFWGREVDQWEKDGFSKEAVRNMEAICTWFYGQARQRNWPEIIYYIQDEMANHGMRGGRMALARAKLFRAVADKVGFRTCASMDGPVEIPTVPFLDIAIPNGAFPITEENIAYIRKSGAELWFYNIGSNRFTFGYYLAKTRPKGRLQWSFGGNSRYVNQVAGLPSISDVRYTLHWDSKLRSGRRANVEEMRQGILDYRYFRTLDRLIGANTRSRRPTVRKAVKTAEQLRDYILGGVKVRNAHSGEDFIAGVWSANTCQRLRWRIAMAITDMVKAGAKEEGK